MEEHQCSSNMSLTAESYQLVKTLLERHRDSAIRDRERTPPTDPVKNIDWVAGNDFTVEVGKEQIADYIVTWGLQPSWIYSLDFLQMTEEDPHSFYHYRARFSTPNAQQPIQGSASVFFVVYISKDRPQQPVETHFIVEANRIVHTPGRTKFIEKWLEDVIESKAVLEL